MYPTCKAKYRQHQMYRARKKIFATPGRFGLAWLLMAWAFCVIGCNPPASPPQGHSGHGHGQEQHGPDTGEAIAVTLFTGKTELFMEYSPLVAQQSASFVSHLTIVGKHFQPVREGQLSIDFVQGGRTISTLVAKKLLREGIFKPQGKSPAAGVYELRLRLDSKQVNDVIVVPKVVIYASVQAAQKANPKSPENSQEIPFLKEQQWKIPFATIVAKKKKLRDSLPLSGESQALPAAHIRLTAPLAGKISGIAEIAQEGKQLGKGQRILFIEPMMLSGASLPQLNQDIRAAQESLQLSKRQIKRLGKMLKARAIASWQLSQARHQSNVYKAQLQAAKTRRSLFYRSRRQGSGRGHAVVIRSPLQGVILRHFVSNGSYVTQGQPLLEIASLRVMRLVALLPEYYANKAQQIQSASYRTLNGKYIDLPKPGAVGAAIDPLARTLPLFFQVVNPGPLKHRQHLSFRVHLSTRTVLAVPAQAVVDDQGTPVVFVQAGGEAFLKKSVRTGIHDQGWVEIRSGIQDGERIVSTGTYELLLSQALKQSKAAGHGHAH